MDPVKRGFFLLVRKPHTLHHASERPVCTQGAREHVT